jgi:hypothetical protein
LPKNQKNNTGQTLSSYNRDYNQYTLKNSETKYWEKWFKVLAPQQLTEEWYQALFCWLYVYKLQR